MGGYCLVRHLFLLLGPLRNEFRLVFVRSRAFPDVSKQMRIFIFQKVQYSKTILFTLKARYFRSTGYAIRRRDIAEMRTEATTTGTQNLLYEISTSQKAFHLIFL